MAQASRDENFVPTLLGVSNVDGTTPVKIYADPTTHRLLIDNAGGATLVVGTTAISGGASGRVLYDNAGVLGEYTITGTAGSVVMSVSPTLVTPVLGAATATSINGLTITTTTGTLTLANGSTLVTAGANSITLTSTGATNVTLPTTGTLMTNPMTTGGDIIYGGASGVPTRLANGSAGQVLTSNGATLAPTWETVSGTGDVVGPASATDNAIARFDTTTGKLIQNSAVTVADTTGVIAGTQGVTLSGSTSGTIALVPTAIAGTNTITFPASTGTVALTSDITNNLTVGTTTIASGTTTRILYDNAGVLGEYTITGSGTIVAMATAPTFVTSITTPSVLATANDSGAIGASGTAFSDLFLASGAVIDFAAGNSVITHSSAILTVSTGDLRVTTAGTNTASVVTVGGTQTLTAKTLTSPTITTASLTGTQLLAEGASIGLDPAGSADGAYSGVTITATAGYTQAFGDLVYLAVADGRWEAADADAAATAGPVALAMVVVAGTDGNACTLLLQGTIRADAKFPTMTVGATQFVGETAGEIQGTIPTGADNVIRTVGYALTANDLYFNPSTDWQITVA